MSGEFIDRENELEGLNKAYMKEEAGFFILYGRRRIGKTTLVKEFSEDKPSFYFLCKRQDFSLEQDRMREKFAAEFDVYLPEAQGLEELLREMVGKVEYDEKFVFVIDEFPYWIQERKEVLSDLQHVWDESLKNQNIFLIITGSAVGMMESEVLDYKSPLYGRRTGQLQLKEMPIGSLREFLPLYSFADLLRTYGAIGAVPFYLKEFDTKKTFFENIRATFLSKLNILYEEAEILLREELRKPNTYFNIVKTIIDGATTLSEIASKSRVSITNINKYLKILERLNIIQREYPITEPPKKQNFLYKILDNYFRFWLSFVYPYQAQIEVRPEGVMDIIKKEYKGYMGPIFERICRKMVREHHEYEKVGRWWYKGEEIDVVALHERERQLLLGECKWSTTKVDTGVLRKLKDKATKVRWKRGERKERFALFSKSEFSKDLKQLADEKDILTLFNLKEMMRIFSIC